MDPPEERVLLAKAVDLEGLELYAPGLKRRMLPLTLFLLNCAMPIVDMQVDEKIPLLELELGRAPD